MNIECTAVDVRSVSAPQHNPWYPSRPPSEADRLAEISALALQDLKGSEQFAELVQFVSTAIGLSNVGLSIVEGEHEWFLSHVAGMSCEGSRDDAFCAHTILVDDLFILEDAAADPLFKDHPKVVEDGIRFYAGAPLRGPSGETVGALCARDTEPRMLSERDRMLLRHGAKLFEGLLARELAERQLVESRALAMAASRAKTQFLANMSHEFRTPLAGVLGSIDMLSQHYECPLSRVEFDEAIDASRRNSRRLLNLLNQILDMSLIESGKLKPKLQQVPTAQLIREVHGQLSADAREKNLDVVFELDESIPDVIETDPSLVRSAMQQLCDNAVKFTDRGTVTVTVSCPNSSASSRQLRISVTDTGIGMSAADCAHICEAFVQVDSSMTRRHEGPGLGLFVAREIALALGGTIDVESSPGAGSTFHFTMEVGDVEDARYMSATSVTECIADEEERAPVAGPPEKPRLDGYRVLVAEDGPDNQRLIQFRLKSAGAEVVMVENGLLAIEAMTESMERNVPFDIVLMDMQMPVMDGYRATTELRQLGVYVPIIAITAHALSTDRQNCLNAGCSDYFAKPLDFDRIFRRMLWWMDGSARKVA